MTTYHYWTIEFRDNNNKKIQSKVVFGCWMDAFKFAEKMDYKKLEGIGIYTFIMPVKIRV